MKTFLTEFEELANQYRASGGAFDDRNKISTLLEAMPKSYRPLVTAIEQNGNKNLEQVKSSLIMEELKLKDDTKSVVKEENASGSDDNMAMAAKSKNNKNEKVCFYCKKKGHYKNQCRKFKQDQASGHCAEKSISTVDIHFDGY